MARRRRLSRQRGPRPARALGAVTALGLALVAVPAVHLARVNGLPAKTGLGVVRPGYPTFAFTAAAAAGVGTLSFTVTPSNGVQPVTDHVRFKYANDAGWVFCTRTAGTTTWTCPRTLSTPAVSGAEMKVAAP